MLRRLRRWRRSTQLPFTISNRRPLCLPPSSFQDFDAEEAETLEDEHEAETELLDALGSCITVVMRLYSVSVC